MILLDTNIIKAAIPCAGTSAVMPHHNCGHFIFDSTARKLTQVSTTGEILSRFVYPYPQDYDFESFKIQIPIDALKSAAKSKERTIPLTVEAGRAILGSIIFTPMDGPSGYHSRAIPAWSEFSQEAGTYDLDLLLLARASLRARYNTPKRGFKLHQRPNGSALMALNAHDEDLVVIMYMRE